MASTDLISPARRLIYIGDVEENRPNSESVNQKLAGNINFLLNRVAIREKFVFSGFFKSSDHDDGSAGIIYIENDADIASYTMAVHKSGSADQSEINIKVYDQNGAYVNDLFGSGVNQPSISGGNGTNVLIGKKGIDTATPSNIQINTAGHSIQIGVLNLTTLLAGYMLVPYIVDHGTGAHNATLDLRLKEI